jgi:hypothetical protein
MLHNFFCRQQWNDNRLEFNDQGGKIKYLTMTERSKVGPALQQKSHYFFLCIPFLGIARPHSQFPHACFCLYIPGICPHIWLQQNVQADPGNI